MGAIPSELAVLSEIPTLYGKGPAFRVAGDRANTAPAVFLISAGKSVMGLISTRR